MIATKANIQANRTSTKQNPNVPFLYRTRTFSGAKNNPTPEGKELSVLKDICLHVFYSDKFEHTQPCYSAEDMTKEIVIRFKELL